MPVSNGYADYVQAGSLCEEVGGASVRPTPPDGVPRDGCQEDVLLEQRRAVVRDRAALARLGWGFGETYADETACGGLPCGRRWRFACVELSSCSYVLDERTGRT